jgi:hypothetical protein
MGSVFSAALVHPPQPIGPEKIKSGNTEITEDAEKTDCFLCVLCALCVLCVDAFDFGL